MPFYLISYRLFTDLDYCDSLEPHPLHLMPQENPWFHGTVCLPRLYVIMSDLKCHLNYIPKKYLLSTVCASAVLDSGDAAVNKREIPSVM